MARSTSREATETSLISGIYALGDEMSRRNFSKSGSGPVHTGPSHRERHAVRPNVAYRQRGDRTRSSEFGAAEVWHPPLGRTTPEVLTQAPGEGYLHAVSAQEIRERLSQLPHDITSQIEVIQLSQMTRKRGLFPLYGMQWGANIYLYPIEAGLVELYTRPPHPQQQIEAKMFGGEWHEEEGYWQLSWTLESLKDFYLNNVLIHEVGHVIDQRNTSFRDRERFANWFAIEYGYRASRHRR